MMSKSPDALSLSLIPVILLLAMFMGVFQSAAWLCRMLARLAEFIVEMLTELAVDDAKS